MNSQRMLQRSGVSYRQLDHWTTKGWLQLTTASRGTGTSRDWAEREDYVAMTMNALVRIGLKAEQAAVFAREAVEAWQRNVAYSVVLYPGVLLSLDVWAIDNGMANEEWRKGKAA